MYDIKKSGDIGWYSFDADITSQQPIYQSYYSYCLNNPLKYTDQSGYVSVGYNNWINVLENNRVDHSAYGNRPDPFVGIDAMWGIMYEQLLMSMFTSVGGTGGVNSVPEAGSADGEEAGTENNNNYQSQKDFIRLFDLTGIKRWFNPEWTHGIPFIFGLRKYSIIKWRSYKWEKIVNIENGEGYFSYTSKRDFEFVIEYLTGNGTIVNYSKNDIEGVLADHIIGNVAYDYKNRPVNKYIQDGPAGFSYAFYFPDNLIYSVRIYERKSYARGISIWFFGNY